MFYRTHGRGALWRARVVNRTVNFSIEALESRRLLSGAFIYVDQNATGHSNGQDWADAFTNLPPALALATAGDTIEVAKGTYVPGPVAADTFQLITGVTIQGGYASGGSASPQPNINVTYLDGDNIDNHVVTGSGTNGTAVLEGFTIENGEADGGGSNDNGGGLFDNGGSPSITGCKFTDNFASDGGGAVYNENSFPYIFNCAFYGNFATFNGAAIYDTMSNVQLINCTFTGNDTFTFAAGSGGALANVISTATVTNCILYGDSAPTDAEIYNSAGSILSVTYSDVDGGFIGTGNINANPLFVSGTNQELQPGSPCINVGSNAAITVFAPDLADNARIAPAGGIVDMGAYEYQGPFIIYVDQSATNGAGTGTSWANAFFNLSQALAVATPGYTIDVAQGMYVPGLLPNDTFQLIDGVTLQGGYATGGSSSPQPSINVTYLDGYGVDDHVVTGSGTDTTAVLDGFTIENGDASGANGGGLFDNDGSPAITDCTFTGNTASGGGGAIYNENNSYPSITNCKFTSNGAVNGGAMDNESGSFPFLYNCEFSGNISTLDGGTIYNDTSDVYALNCTFTGNSTNVFATGSGGAIANLNSSTATLTNCILYNNSARFDDEIYNSGSTSNVTYSDVEGGYSGTGNINANPLFVSGTQELQTGSPCINTGSNGPVWLVEIEDHINTDLAGNPRIAFTTVDMGAYEYQGPTSLLFSQGPPSNVTSGTTVSQIIVNQEQNGSPVSDGSTVTLSLTGNPAGVTLQGNTAAVNASGQAIFNNLKVTGTAGSYTLTATDGSDTAATSGSFNLTAQSNPTPGLIYLTPPPASIAANTVLPSVVVEVVLNGARDTNDNSSVSIEVDNVAIASTTAVQGVATFNGLEFNAPGNFTMVAHDSNYDTASANFTITSPVVTTSLVFGPQPLPTSVQAGQSITPAITVTEVPSSGTLNDNTSYVTLTLVSSSSGGALGGTLIEKVGDNVARFSNLTPSTPGTYEISASDGNDASAEFSITALAPDAAKLVFSTISGFQVGLNVPVPTFTVSVENSNGNVVSSDDSTISVLVLIPNDGAYGGTSLVQAVQGVATFNFFFIGQGRTFTLQATDAADGLTGVSQPFTITPGPADYFYVPGGSTAIAGTSTGIYVQAQDILRNIAIGDNSSLALTLDSGPAGGTLGGILTTSFIAGSALFDNVVFNKAGIYDLTVNDADDDLSQAFEITVTANAVPAELAFIQEPSNTSTGFAIDPPVIVGVEDQFGNLITTDESGQVTLSIASATGDATLGGVITAAVQNGIATFNQVSLGAAGTYTLLASDGSDTDATSTSFTVAAPLTLYVDQNATGGNNGKDWPDAFSSLQSALAIAVDGDRIDVAQGDYSPGSDPTDTFQLIDGVTIQGGYQTGGFSGPNPTAYPTLLDGLGNNYHVVTGNGTDFSAVLDGFTITSGNADGNGDSDSGYGGGIVADGGSPTVMDCVFTDNTAVDGGAVYFANEGSAAATLINCLFVANTASQSGGAIYDNDASPTVTNCTFTANSAVEYGGAFENDQTSSPTLTNCILWNDTAGYGFEEISNDYVFGELGSSNPIVNYSDIDGGYSGSNDIDADPMFVNAGGNNFQLQVTSPCINAGDNGAPALAGVETDLAGDPRINDLVVDMGAYEIQLSTATIYVDQKATGGNNGEDWADAFTNLQSALAIALPGNTIEVAQGDYSPGSDPTDTFQLLDLVTIQGGFPTGGANSPDPSAYPTLLDGLENNYHVVTGSGTNASAVLEGFTITDGNADGNGDSNSSYGGGMINDDGSPTLMDCIFTNNTASYGGGAVYNAADVYSPGEVVAPAATLTDCIFTGNTSSYVGGALYNFGINDFSFSPTLINCLFAGNSAANDGGAIDDSGASPILTNCTFTANSAANYGGAIEDDTNSYPTLTNCILWNDSAAFSPSSEIDFDSGYDYYPYATVNNSDVDSGYSGTGDIDADPLFVDPTNGNFQLQPNSPCINAGDNDAPGLASVGTDLAGNPRIIDGVVDMGAYEAQLADVVWTGLGDGINWSDPNNWSDDLVPTQNDDATIPIGFGQVQVEDGSFMVHSLNSASSILVSGGSLTLLEPSVIDGLLTLQNGGTLDITTGSLILDYGSAADPISAIQSYLASGYNRNTWTGEGIISSAAAADPTAYVLGYADGNNPVDAANTGVPAGEIKIMYTVSGDVNLSGGVDLSDLVIVASDFGETGADWASGDLNYDGNVDLSDLVIVASNFGASVAQQPAFSMPTAATISPAPAAPRSDVAPILSAPAAVAQPNVASGVSVKKAAIPPAIVSSSFVAPGMIEDVLTDVWKSLSPAASGGLFSRESLNGDVGVLD
jgi:predicted outer membrane repeat protein